MDKIFPFGFPGPTQWYLTLYVLTLVLHVLFMNYVLAGTIVLAGGGLASRLSRARSGPILTVLKDWMPFVLSAAITAGIAPLLFVQILYQREFYTANLLLFHRWMAILPVLIIAFYLLYLLKARKLDGRTVLKALAAIGAALAMVFVAWSWTENHMLALNEHIWPEQYQSESMVYHNLAIWPRLALWVVGSFPTLALLLAWQLRAGASGTKPADHVRTAGPLAMLALFGLIASPVAAYAFINAAGPTAHAAVLSAAARPYLIAAVIGMLLQTFAWLIVIGRRALPAPILALASVGLGMTFIGAAVVRETIRLTTLNAAALARHAAAVHVAGLFVFLFFTLCALLTIAWVVIRVRREIRAAPGTN